MLNKKNYLVWGFLFLLIFFSSSILAAGVKPLILNFDLKPGESTNFELTLTPSGARETIKLTPYQPTQNLSGGLNYEVGDPTKHLALNWIELAESQVIVAPNQDRVVSGQINVPYDAAGSHTAVVMVEQVDSADQNDNLLQFKVRYAARININIDRPGQQMKAEISKIELKKNKDGNPELLSTIKNVSSLHFNAAAEATIRDENNRLIERLNVVSKAAARIDNLSTRIYPNSEVNFQADLSQPIFPGEYNLQVYLNYGDNRKLVERKTITLEEKLTKSGKVRHLSLEPELISKEIRAGGPVTQVIKLNNISNEDYKLKINKKELLTDPEHSVFKLGELQLRGEEDLELASRSSDRLVFILRSPRDANDGGYYGQLEVAVIDQNNEEIEKQNIDLEILVGQEWEYRVEVEDLKFKKEDQVQQFNLDLKNLSSVHILPEASLNLIDNEGVTVESFNFNLPEAKTKLLPEESITMNKKTTEIKAGSYTAEIIIRNKGEEIDTIKKTITIN